MCLKLPKNKLILISLEHLFFTTYRQVLAKALAKSINHNEIVLLKFLSVT